MGLLCVSLHVYVFLGFGDVVCFFFFFFFFCTFVLSYSGLLLLYYYSFIGFSIFLEFCLFSNERGKEKGVGLDV